MSRKISDAGLKLIKSFEGCRLTSYKPVPTETYWTIGWGHYGPDVKQGMTITQAQADAMLVNDLAKYESYVNNPIYVPVTAQLNQNQFDALVSFCYNCGPGNLQSLCRGRTIAHIADNITKYDKAAGKVLAGLTRRRKAELELFNKESVDEVTRAEYEALEKRVSTMEKVNELIPAPKWFVSEFGSADLNGKIADPKLTNEGWRTLAIGLRVSKK